RRSWCSRPSPSACSPAPCGRPTCATAHRSRRRPSTEGPRSEGPARGSTASPPVRCLHGRRGPAAGRRRRPGQARRMPPSRPSRPATTLRSVFAPQLERVRADPTAEAVTDVGTPRGWLVERRVCDLLEPFVTHLPRDDGDLARYAGLTGDVAAVLLDRLPAVELDDRQNDAPTLGCLL